MILKNLGKLVKNDNTKICSMQKKMCLVFLLSRLDEFVITCVKLCIMLSHASKGHTPIPMISYIFRVILNCTMASLTLHAA